MTYNEWKKIEQQKSCKSRLKGTKMNKLDNIRACSMVIKIIQINFCIKDEPFDCS